MFTSVGISERHFQQQPLEVLSNTHLLGWRRENGAEMRENSTKRKSGVGGEYYVEE